MPTQVYKTIIAAEYQGLGVAQNALRDFNALGTALENLERIGTRRSGNFGSAVPFSDSQQQALLRTSVRDYDELTRAITRLRDAELARAQAHNRLGRPEGAKGWVGAMTTDKYGNPAVDRAGTDVMRERLDLQSRTRVDAASQALERAYIKAKTEVDREADAARRRGLFGSMADTFSKPGGAINYAPRNDPIATAVRTGLDDSQRMVATKFRQQEKELQDAAQRGITAARKEAAAREKAANDLARQREAELRGAVAQAARISAERRKAAEREAADLEKNRQAINALHTKRIQAEDAQMRTAVEGLRQQSIYDGFTPTYNNPDPTTKVGVAQGDINKAERDLAVATQRRADLLAQGLPRGVAMIAADGMYDAATRRLTLARTKLAALETKQSLGQQFMSGFKGASDRPYAEQIGQAFKFSVFYGTAYKLLFAFTTTMTATLQEGIAFQSAMTELKIASGASADAANEMAVNLSKQAVAAGQAPSVGVEIGARSLGLFGVTESAGASQDDQQRVADISARVVSRMALGSDLPITELQTQLAAVSNAFNTGAAGQIRAADLDAYFGRQFGVQQGLILQAVAESANVGQAAGFSQEEVSAIAAAMISRTGQSPSTASGWMAQIFSRGGEGSLADVTQKYGIDPSAELSTQIAELAQIYKSASGSEQSEILASFGRGKVQNAAEVLLGSFDEIIGAANRAGTEAGGASEEVAEMRLNDIGGQIKVTVAAMQAFASELGRTGLLDILGVGVVAFREMVEAVTSLLQAWNELPGAVRASVAALLLLSAAGRTGAVRGAVGTALDVGSMRGGGVAGGVTGVAAGGRALLASAGPWLAAAAGLYALGELYGSTNELKEAQKEAAKSLNLTPLGVDATADDYRSRAAELGQNATITREAATGSWMNRILPSSRDSAAGLQDDAANMDAEARRLQANAKLIENAAADMADGTQSLITGFDKDGLAASLQAITDRGGSASERMDALADAITGAGEAAGNEAAKYDPKLFAAQQTDPLVALLGENISGITGKPMSAEAVRQALGGIGGTPESGVTKSLSLAGIGGFEDFDVAGATKAAEELVARTEGTSGYIGTEEYNTAVENVRDYLLSQTRQGRLLVDAAARFTSDEGLNAVVASLAELSALDSTTQETDYKGLIRNARRNARNIRNSIKRTDDPGEEMFVQLDVARRLIAQRQFDELENLRRAAQRNAKGRAEVAQVGRRFLRRELRAAIKGGNQDLLAEIIGQAGAGAVAIARAIIQEAINAARAARAAYLMIAQVKREAQSVLGAEIEAVRGGLGQAAVANPLLAQAQQQMAALPSMQTAGDWEDNVYASGSDVPGFEPPPTPDAPKAPKKGKSAEDKKAEREEARQAMLELRNNLYLLSIDMTDPLAMAVAAVKDARRRLASDLGAGADKNTIAADRVALRQAQAEREATAFQQRLDTVTTAEELGRISHRKYISYLENERKRLNSIKDRTFQQQSQLDQIDRLMKDAAESMQGMWNFGDIKLPTPYQIRRQVEQMRGEGTRDGGRPELPPFRREQARADRATSLDATSRQVQNSSTIYIDGADTGKVRQIISETLAKSNATVTNRPRRR